MNTSVLKSFGFWISVLTAIAGLLVSQGVILSGSTVDMIVGWVVTLIGTLGGHHVAAKATTAATIAKL